MEYSNFVLQTDSAEAAVDNCPERMDAADAEAPTPLRIETAVGFWSGMGTAVLRFFWRARKKKKNKQEAAGEQNKGRHRYDFLMF